MIKQFIQISIIIVLIGCSKSDTNQEEQIAEVPTIFFSNIYYENIIDNELKATVKFKFEGNKVIEENGFSPDGDLLNQTIFQYNNFNLLEKRTFYDSNGKISTIKNYDYVNKNISSIETIRNIGAIPDTLYNIYTYSNNSIENEWVNSNGYRLGLVKYILNEDGSIYKSDNGISANVVLKDDLPVSKTIVNGSDIEEFEHTYLDTPRPNGPWKDFWKNFYGNMNNQIIVHIGGLISYEETADLTKHITFAGRRLQVKYEFNSDELPIKIEKTFDSSFKSVWHIEYQK